jgi:hypothetical protein
MPEHTGAGDEEEETEDRAAVRARERRTLSKRRRNRARYRPRTLSSVLICFIICAVELELVMGSSEEPDEAGGLLPVAAQQVIGVLGGVAATVALSRSRALPGKFTPTNHKRWQIASCLTDCL